MRAISRARFDALAGYARLPSTRLLADELSWYEDQNGDVVATLVRDRDNLFTGVILVRDRAERFRWVDQTAYFSSRALTVGAIAIAMIGAANELDRARTQGDELAPIDFFTRVVPTGKAHPLFNRVATSAGHAAARQMVSNVMRWYNTSDMNYVEQFQSTGFDARLWEMYLFATLIEAGFDVSFPKPAPDFLASGVTGAFCIEATTANQSVIGGLPAPSPRPSPLEHASVVDAYLDHYLPIKFAGPLVAKLGKRYWEHPECQGIPLAFAIQDFHDGDAMTYSSGSLHKYLYGQVFHEEDDSYHRVTDHRWGTKVVPSGFFDLPDAEHVSAVLFNSGGTISKFNRMGVAAGFGVDDVTLFHIGIKHDSSRPGLRADFRSEVVDGYEEHWVDGLNVFHNPNALHPLPIDYLPGAMHHFWDPVEGSQVMVPEGHVFSSQTLVINAASDTELGRVQAE